MDLIYILTNDPVLLESWGKLFSRGGYKTLMFNQAKILLERIDAEELPCCIVAETPFSRISTLQLLERMQNKIAAIPVILIAQNSDISSAVEALRAGAADYIEMPVVDRILIESVERAIADHALPG